MGLVEKYDASYLTVNITSKIIIKTADRIRIDKTDADKLISSKVYEFILIEHIEKILKYHQKKNKKWLFHYVTLYKLSKNQIKRLIISSTHLKPINPLIVGSGKKYVPVFEYHEYPDQVLYFKRKKKIIKIVIDPIPEI